MFLYEILVFAVGACVGSFLNVVIHRLPLGQSLVFPPSRCPGCGTRIRPWDNVPILGYLWLLGRCRACRASISARYPVVELTNALFYLAIFQRTGLTLSFLPVAAMVSMTLALIYIDLDVQLLPDVMTIPGVLCGIAAGALGVGQLVPGLRMTGSWLEAVIGAIAGSSAILLILGLYWLVRRVQGMGWGDVKMMAMIGACAGWQGAIVILLLAAFLGTIIGVPVALRHKDGMQYALPFGVFLGIALLMVVFFGDSMVWMAPLLMQR